MSTISFGSIGSSTASAIDVFFTVPTESNGFSAGFSIKDSNLTDTFPTFTSSSAICISVCHCQ